MCCIATGLVKEAEKDRECEKSRKRTQVLECGFHKHLVFFRSDLFLKERFKKQSFMFGMKRGIRLRHSE